MIKFSDLQYLVDRPEPSRIFLEARQIAGYQIQSQFDKINTVNVTSSYEGFKWVKAELTYPSFDNLTFSYKNSIFSVIIELIDDIGTSFSNQQQDRLLNACKLHNLIPCLFKIKVEYKSTLQIDSAIKNDSFNYVLKPFESDWNLFNPISKNRINPLELSSEIPQKMSKWELSNFAIQIVREDIVRQGNEVLSFCDLPEINPQIWFKDDANNINWVIVKHITNETDFDYKVWVGLETISTELKLYNGYFGAVQFFSLNTNSSTELIRADAMNVKYRGLEKIKLH